MSESDMKRASLANLRAMKERGELHHAADAPAGEDLGAEFWAKAEVEEPRRPRSVHLKLDPDVFEFFHKQSGGKGHLTKMQAVLKAYAKAHKHP